MLSRRRFVRLAGIALVAHAAKAAGAFPDSEMSTYQWGHGISQFGALKSLRAEIGPHVARSVSFFLAACRHGNVS